MTAAEKIEKLRGAYEDVIWMAIRYANGRRTYASSMVRDSIKDFQEVFPDWKPVMDETIKSDRERIEKHYAKVGKEAPQLETDWLDDLMEQKVDK